MRARTCVSAVVFVARKPRPCPSYSRRRDRNNCVHWRSLYKGGGVYVCSRFGNLVGGTKHAAVLSLYLHLQKKATTDGEFNALFFLCSLAGISPPISTCSHRPGRSSVPLEVQTTLCTCGLAAVSIDFVVVQVMLFSLPSAITMRPAGPGITLIRPAEILAAKDCLDAMSKAWVWDDCKQAGFQFHVHFCLCTPSP